MSTLKYVSADGLLASISRIIRILYSGWDYTLEYVSIDGLLASISIILIILYSDWV